MEIKELLKIAFRAGQQVEISGIILDDDAEFDEWIEENQHLVKSVGLADVGKPWSEMKDGDEMILRCRKVKGKFELCSE